MKIEDVIGFYGDDELSVYIKKNLDLYCKLAFYQLLVEKSIKFFMDISSDKENSECEEVKNNG